MPPIRSNTALSFAVPTGRFYKVLHIPERGAPKRCFTIGFLGFSHSPREYAPTTKRNLLFSKPSFFGKRNLRFRNLRFSKPSFFETFGKRRFHSETFVKRNETFETKPSFSSRGPQGRTEVGRPGGGQGQVILMFTE